MLFKQKGTDAELKVEGCGQLLGIRVVEECISEVGRMDGASYLT